MVLIDQIAGSTKCINVENKIANISSPLPKFPLMYFYELKIVVHQFWCFKNPVLFIINKSWTL